MNLRTSVATMSCISLFLSLIEVRSYQKSYASAFRSRPVHRFVLRADVDGRFSYSMELMQRKSCTKPSLLISLALLLVDQWQEDVKMYFLVEELLQMRSSSPIHMFSSTSSAHFLVFGLIHAMDQGFVLYCGLCSYLGCLDTFIWCFRSFWSMFIPLFGSQGCRLNSGS